MRKQLLILAIALATAAGMMAQRTSMTLSGQWQLHLEPTGVRAETDATTLNDRLPQSFDQTIVLPGTTDTNRKGKPNDNKAETTNLSRLYPFIGFAWYKRTVDIPKSWKGRAITLTMERTKPTKVWVDGQPVGINDNISTPQVYDLSPWLKPGRHEIVVRVDNGGSVPRKVIESSHAYSESTQTNWNGIIGELFLQATNRLHVSDLQLYPDVPHRQVRVKFAISDSSLVKRGTKAVVSAEAWNSAVAHTPQPMTINLDRGKAQYELVYALGPDAQLWSEFSPALYKLTVELPGIDRETADFGLREFKSQGTQFAINGTTTFLRGKHDACVFPLTGHTAMDVATWRHYFQTAKAYGINHYRFHSWCPPRACFEAASIEGIYLQPELPFWGMMDGKNAELQAFLLKEGRHIMDAYGNNASFVMFALGNELSGSAEAMRSLVDNFRAHDARHLYAYGSNNFLGFKGYIPGEDFLVTCRIGGEQPQSLNTHTRASFSFADAYDGGYLNHSYPNTVMTFAEAIKGCPVPVIGHETGQFQIYPNYDEIRKYTGVLYPYNLEEFRSRLQKAGMLSQAHDFFRASGLWAVELYKADIEMSLRTPGFAGFQMLDLQDYPGQGSAYIGILDAFMETKGLVEPERWRGFCSPTVPLLEIDRFCFTTDEPLRAELKIAHYEPTSLNGHQLSWRLTSDNNSVLAEGRLPIKADGQGLIGVGHIDTSLAFATRAQQLTLTLAIDGTPHRNSYRLWVYPAKTDVKVPQNVRVTRSLDPSALRRLADGGRVLWMPDTTQLQGQTVGGLFQTDYWNYRMFETISKKNHKPVSPGTLGLLIDATHPALSLFPTEMHTDWQWFSIVKNSYPLILDAFPEGFRPIVQPIDNVERNHRLGLLFELKVGRGRLMVCMANLLAAMDKPEVRQFYASLLAYMSSDKFAPAVSLSPSELQTLLHTKVEATKMDKLGNISYD